MANQSKIEWCDSTFNPWIGCTKVSPACDNCYAAVSTPVRVHGIEWGAGKPRQRTKDANWKKPLKWDVEPFYKCDECGWRGDEKSCHALVNTVIPRCGNCESNLLSFAKRRVFCASLSDWLDNEVPIEWLVDLLNLIRLTPNLDWLLLTKRIGNFERRLIDAGSHVANTMDYPGELELYISDWVHSKCPPENVWLGITVINQEEADRDIPKLLATPAHIRFLSIEPMLGPIDLENLPSVSGIGRYLNAINDCGAVGSDIPGRIDWVICGGESGKEARPLHPDWVRSLRDQCHDSGVPFLFKQWGEYAPNWLNDNNGNKIPGSEWVDRMGKKTAGRKIDGEIHSEFPE